MTANPSQHSGVGVGYCYLGKTTATCLHHGRFSTTSMKLKKIPHPRRTMLSLEIFSKQPPLLRADYRLLTGHCGRAEIQNLWQVICTVKHPIAAPNSKVRGKETWNIIGTWHQKYAFFHLPWFSTLLDFQFMRRGTTVNPGRDSTKHVRI